MDTAFWNRFDQYVDEHLDDYLRDLGRLCAQPSVAAQNYGIADCAVLVQKMLGEYGYEAEIMPTEGHPVVFGTGQGETDKRMLFYLHYDVQPAEPLELWESPPWELTRKNGAVYARGATDDKGHIMTRLAALDALRKVGGNIPCDVKFLIEGEEEIGSPSIGPFIQDNKELVQADACIWEFGGVDSEGRPIIALGLRGIAFVELSVKTADVDIHSGQGGSIFQNAAWRLLWAINSLKDQNEKILIPGFYDDVLPASDVDLTLLEKMPDQSEAWKKLYGIDKFLLDREPGKELRRAAVFEPTCNICGIESGYNGEGGKTIIPAEAKAKIDFRLVPNQTPQDILKKLRKHLDDQGFTDVEVSFTGGYAPGKVDPEDEFVKITAETAPSVYGIPPIIEPMVGGSGPMSWFLEYLDDMPIVTVGSGYPGGKVHAPNEHLRIDYFLQGIKHSARIIHEFAHS